MTNYDRWTCTDCGRDINRWAQFTDDELGALANLDVVLPHEGHPDVVKNLALELKAELERRRSA